MFDANNYSFSPITYQKQILGVKRTLDFFEFLVTGKGIPIIVENSNFWSWKKVPRKAMQNENILSSTKTKMHL